MSNDDTGTDDTGTLEAAIRAAMPDVGQYVGRSTIDAATRDHAPHTPYVPTTGTTGRRQTWADVPADYVRLIGPVRIVCKAGSSHTAHCTACGSWYGPKGLRAIAAVVLRHRRCDGGTRTARTTYNVSTGTTAAVAAGVAARRAAANDPA